MCGIAGLVGSAPPLGARRSVEAMTDALRRRGPDSAGLETWDGAVLGHRRLSIFDLSPAGRQPMLSDDRVVGVVFNGAVYNFLALRSELMREGWRFHSRTDTEVLVHGYRAWGIDGLVERLRGMFAFALWDDRMRRLYLVRDRLGVKPLAYVRRGGALAFASTPRALRAGGFAHQLDPAGVAEFLEFGYVTDDRSIYDGVAKVPPATIVEWTERGVSQRSYWSPPSAGSRAPAFADAVDETERLLLQAVERRLHADVPVGALLSGGIDSALVCWAIARLGGGVTAFTVATPGDAADESAAACATAQRLGISHRVLPLSDAEAFAPDELVSAYAEPFACQSALGMLRVSRAVAAEARVLLTGDGGDDVFLGYPRHRHLLATSAAARAIPSALARGWYTARGAVPMAGPLRRAVRFLDYATGGLGAFISAHDGLPGFAGEGLLGERLAGAVVAHRRIPWTHASARRGLEEYLAHDLRTQFVGEYLTKVDGATMHHALEARSPFLDQEMWEFAASLPLATRLHGGRLKSILRALAARRVGGALARGRKRGFTIPVERWMAGRWYGSVRARLADSTLARDGWVEQPALTRALADARASGRATHRLWYLLVLEEWMRAERDTAPPRASMPASSPRVPVLR